MRRFRRAALPLATLVLVGGCAGLDVGATLGDGAASVRLGTGGAGITVRTDRGGVAVSGSASRRRSGTSAPRRIDDKGGGPYIASRFERTEVPHTLIAKPVAQGRLTSRFGPRGSRPHNGVDYAAPHGTAVYAAGDGVVDKLYTSASYGNYVRIRHDNEFHTAYAHLAGFARGLRVGVRVRRGQVIGAVGSTGRSSAPHLHYELAWRGTAVDPLLR